MFTVKNKETGKNPYFALIYIEAPHLAMACNPQWSKCVPDKLDLTCQCHM